MPLNHILDGQITLTQWISGQQPQDHTESNKLEITNSMLWVMSRVCQKEQRGRTEEEISVFETWMLARDWSLSQSAYDSVFETLLWKPPFTKWVQNRST